ncbi:MAG: DUF2309 domain-containing protein [Myxococcales bacterium]|nr:DUF2309 domain-containing protein [Myxococcales bacterium]MCB9526434.1 DUF2309 domain-containing protein [Myxococcales bacterium]
MAEASPRARIEAAVAHASHLVPSQSPLDRFVHHNPLHHFEELPFEVAVERAAELFGNAPYWSEAAYQAEYRRGRIQDDDLDWAIARAAPEDAPLGVGVTRHALMRAMLEHPVAALNGPALAWHLAETDVLTVARPGLRPEVFHRLVSKAGGDVPRALGSLWAACRRRLGDAPPPPEAPRGLRLRDRLVDAGRGDIDGLIHSLLIRWSGAYLDHGIAHWPMSHRDRPFLEAVRLHLQHGRGLGRGWLAHVGAWFRSAEGQRLDALDTIHRMLERLGHPPADWRAVLERTALALPGWAGMFQRLADRPDTAPVRQALPTALADFIAVALVLEVGIGEHLLPGKGPLVRRVPAPGAAMAPATCAPAWLFFQIAQSLGLNDYAVDRLDDVELQAVLAEARAFDGPRRQAVLHAAYERRFRVEHLDALARHAVDQAARPAPERRVQCVFCIDDREESMRRHAEELAPWIQTLGVAANFGLSMYYQGVHDSRPVALGPAPVEPQHYVREVFVDAQPAPSRWRAWAKHGINVGSQTLLRGAVVTLAGAFSAAPLTTQVLSPALHERLNRPSQRGKTRLEYEATGDARHPNGWKVGYTLDEQVGVVRRTLESMSLLRDFAPLVLCLGHGSDSANNPHAAAYNCGACGGGRSAPNARLFAKMANDPRVRERLAAEGIHIPADTVFVGGYHNTANDDVLISDADEVPPSHRAPLDETLAALAEAAKHDALERCRRFENVPLDVTPEQALRHVRARVNDFSQPRPEYNHNGNALALVGRRAWSRGLFLDQRAFLCSYDPDSDPDGHILADLLQMAVPVGAGINLEYWFAAIDPYGYGSGTKTAHNITGYLGVMDGHQSDLRIGLYHQMVELHEPVRLLCVVEAPPERLLAIAQARPMVGRLVTNGWVLLASLDPATGAVQYFEDGAFRPWPTPLDPLPRVPTSSDWFRGNRGYLPPAQVGFGDEEVA